VARDLRGDRLVLELRLDDVARPSLGEHDHGRASLQRLVTAGLAAIAIVAVARSRTDASITSDHIHDVAKLLFAFSTFWMYIWFSQAMLIWYTNMPEEASWYSVRGFGNWGVLMWATSR